MPAPTSRRPEVHRPQWDWERFDCMVARNAAWGRWRRERTTESHEDFRTKRFRSHHLVRQMKRLFWQTWLETQCRLSVENPRLAARAIRRQLGSTRRRLPSSMSSPADPNLRISGAAALSAWCNHFRDVPESAATQNQGGTQATAQKTMIMPQVSVDCAGRCQQRVATLTTLLRNLSFYACYPSCPSAVLQAPMASHMRPFEWMMIACMLLSCLF